MFKRIIIDIDVPQNIHDEIASLDAKDEIDGAMSLTFKHQDAIDEIVDPPLSAAIEALEEVGYIVKVTRE